MSYENLQRPTRIDEDRILQLKTLFPQAFSDGKINLSVLRQEIAGNDENLFEENEEESYGLNWVGKAESRRLAFLPPEGTIKYVEGKGVSENNTKNFLIEGDNLEVLRVLKESYKGRIKMIYIDPPYNTGSDFIYNDDYKEPLTRYLQKSGQADEDGLLTSNPKSNGRFHANWLNMIYPRLRLAKELLKRDGVIVIHIDENEEFNLELILNEIFGEENRLGKIIWDKRNPKGDSSGIAYQHESILVFAKDKNYLVSINELVRPKANAEKILKKAKELFEKLGQRNIPDELVNVIKKYNLPKDKFEKYEQIYDLEAINKEFKAWINSQEYLSGGEAAYNSIDEKGDVYRPVSMAWPNKKKAPDDYFIPLIHPITKKPCPVPNRGWRNPPDTMRKLLDEDKILFGADETTIPNRKYLLKENMFENIPSVIRFGASDDALFDKLGVSFDNPKPYRFSAELISYFTEGEDIILDFFAGSGTTGHAVLEANRKDKGKRNFILVQVPEKLEDGKSTIFDITRLRLEKSIEMMNQEDQNEGEFDRGFAVYRLDKSNLNKWNQYNGDNIEQLENNLNLFTHSHFTNGWTEKDVVIELMLYQGFPLDSRLEQRYMNNKLWIVSHSEIPLKMIVCLDKHIEQSTIEKVVDYYANGIFICIDDALSNQSKVILSETMKVKTI
ncbi:site-specific DNA-methyltransferase [Brevibacillus borstelensis]|jgi:adenine-specific DNA-methyltransferase|uniref:site-specific DNA-methyltransferase n=1 Tax=Brevibacillus borstelensis TaxID=45462 RepID=UPI00203B5035|nr:site-specific DNA-methyltransferase [Brevibacillus borstelensis]MCM3472188.1 site-specific DNA-methyltransferase [Brevibacillus borstelensis]